MVTGRDPSGCIRTHPASLLHRLDGWCCQEGRRAEVLTALVREVPLSVLSKRGIGSAPVVFPVQSYILEICADRDRKECRMGNRSPSKTQQSTTVTLSPATPAGLMTRSTMIGQGTIRVILAILACTAWMSVSSLLILLNK